MVLYFGQILKRLATDFSHRCGYCDDLDFYAGGYTVYQVEHFAPESKFPDLKYDYDNLIYACPWCNRAKWDKWPSDDPKKNIIGNIGFVDPCTDEYFLHLDRNEDGSIKCLSPLGKYMYDTLHLHLKRHEVIHNIDKLKEAHDRLERNIEEDKEAGKDISVKIATKQLIDDQFFKYYNLLQKLAQEIT